MGTVSTKISNIKLNLSNQNKRVLSENISTKTKELVSEYNDYTNEVIGELKDTNFYKNVSETVQTIQDSNAYKNTQATISNGVEKAFSIFENIEDNNTGEIAQGESTPTTNKEDISPKTETQPAPKPTTTPKSDGTVTGDWPSDSNHNNASEVEKYLMNEMGFNKAATTAVMANMYHESRFNTHTSGDRGTSYGLSQWHDSRKNNLINYCNKNGYDYTTVEGQMKFYEYEMKTSYPKVYEKLKNTPDTAEGAYEAADYYCVYYEVPANKHEQGDKRGSMAMKQYNSTKA